jgi:hypothetical protein
VSYATTPATVTFVWNGATTPLVVFFQNGVRVFNTPNDGTTSLPLAPGTYVFQVCEPASTVCSNDVTVTVT